MAFLTLNGVTVPVAATSGTFSYESVGGDSERSPLGGLEGGALALKREWKMTTTPVAPSEVDAWVGLIEGRGHSFPFDTSLYSGRGRGVSSSTSTSIVGGAKYGAGCLSVPNIVGQATWATALGSVWTVVAWVNRQEGAGWEHRILRSDGVEWKDGVLATGLNTGEFAVTAGALVLSGSDGTDWLFDDVVAMPYAIPSGWVAGMYAHHSAAWTSLPRVAAAGTFYPSALTVRGKVTDSRLVRGVFGGSLTSGYALEFSIREV